LAIGFQDLSPELQSDLINLQNAYGKSVLYSF